MGDNQDLEQWAKSVDLDSATVAVLKEEGFTNLELLRHLSPDRVTENLQKTKRLPLAQSLALKSAIEILGNESSAGEEAETSECHGSRQDHIGEYLSKQTTAQALDEEGETFRLLLVGKTGAGKSTTGNTILGEDVFDSEASFDSVTDLCQLKRSQCNGVNIEILDSPGLFDTRKGHEAVATAIAKSVAGMNPGPHAILYIIKIGRYTEEEEGVYNRLLELFDKHLASYTIVIFTGGDSIKSGRNMEDMLANAPESMKRVLRACQNRYVVFNNMMCDKQPQVDLLLQKVRELVAANGGKPYTCPKYFHIGEAMEEEVRKKMANVEKQHLQSKQYVQELEVKAKQAEEAVEREKEEFEKRDQARKKEMEELEAKRTEQLESLKQQLEQQQLSEEKRRQKTEAFLKKLEEDRLQQMREMEEERRVERENLNRKEEEMSKMIEGRMEEERKLREEMALAHEQEMNELKDRIIDGQEPSLVEYVMAPFVHLIEGVCNLIRKLGSEFDGE